MRIISSKILSSIVLILISTAGFAFQVPTLDERVNDHAHMFSAATISNLEHTLSDFEAKSSVQIAILTVDSLDGAVLEDAAITTANQWGLGQRGKDNGLLIFISKQDRAIRIEVGAGLESIITDARSGRVIDSIIIPNFRSNNYDYGINAAVASLINDIDPDFSLPAVTSDTNDVIITPTPEPLPFNTYPFERVCIYLIIFCTMLEITFLNLKYIKKSLAKVVDAQLLNKDNAKYDDFFPEEKIEAEDKPIDITAPKATRYDYLPVPADLDASIEETEEEFSGKSVTFTKEPFSELSLLVDEQTRNKVKSRLKLSLLLQEMQASVHAIIVPILTFDVWLLASSPLIVITVFGLIGYVMGKFIFLNKKITRYLPHDPANTFYNNFISGRYSSSRSGFGSGGGFSGGGGGFRGGGSSGRW